MEINNIQQSVFQNQERRKKRKVIHRQKGLGVYRKLFALLLRLSCTPDETECTREKEMERGKKRATFVREEINLSTKV